MKEVSPAATSGTGNVCIENEREYDYDRYHEGRRARVVTLRAKLEAEGLGTNSEHRRSAIAEANLAFSEAGEQFKRDRSKDSLLAMGDAFDQLCALWELEGAAEVMP